MIALGCAPGAHAAATLTGIVVQDRMNGPAVGRVPISAPGVTPTSSGNDGVFVLRFPQAGPGDEVSIHAGDKAWAVVNDEALSLRLPSAGGIGKWQLTIVVATPVERMRRRGELYGLVFREAVEQQYQSKLNELNLRLQLTEQERARERERLEREVQTARALSQDASKRIAEATPEEAGSLYKKALALFSQGQVEQALLALSDEQLERENKALQAKEAQLVSAWQLKAQMLVTRLDFEGAAKAQDTATRIAPGSFNAWFGYAWFNQERNDFQAARKGYERALQLAREASKASDVAMTLNNLGNLSRAENRHAEARQHYEEALKLCRELARTNPAAYLPHVAGGLNNLGVLSRDENRPAEARQLYQEALKLYRELARSTPAVYLSGMALTLNNEVALEFRSS
ncbi:tetratricopeptide repeat protein [Curvibacter gracilis]|uniref:tetratricopeptide repeat protein n=1 Tax=Curvibacter gracilis TaxID=230310 RepID=UPI0004840264|nr:tetratricopeptide repeat protein [Curvibacter gracilis]